MADMTDLDAILKTEYLGTFDEACKMLDEASEISTERFIRNPMFLDEEIIVKRQKAMQMSYYKYGPVYSNYIANKYMKPLEDIVIRAEKYEKTHNTEFLIDLINFAMLAYWQRTKSVIKFIELDMWCVMLKDELYSAKSCLQSVKDMLDMYNEDKELAYLVIIALIAKYEVQYPQYEDADYKGTDGNVEIAGFSYNEIKNYGKDNY